MTICLLGCELPHILNTMQPRIMAASLSMYERKLYSMKGRSFMVSGKIEKNQQVQDGVVRRRTVLTGAAWTVPTIALTVAAPAAVASQVPCVPETPGSVLSERTGFTTPIRTVTSGDHLERQYAVGSRVDWYFTLRNTGSTIIPAGQLTEVVTIGRNGAAWLTPQISLPNGFTLVSTTSAGNVLAEYTAVSTRDIQPGESFVFGASAQVSGAPTSQQGSIRVVATAASGFQCDGTTPYVRTTSTSTSDQYIRDRNS